MLSSNISNYLPDKKKELKMPDNTEVNLIISN